MQKKKKSLNAVAVSLLPLVGTYSTAAESNLSTVISPSSAGYWHGFVRQLCRPPAGAQSQTGARIGLGHIGHRRAMLPSCRLRDPELAASPEHHLGSRPGSLPGLRLRKTVVGVEKRAGLVETKGCK